MLNKRILREIIYGEKIHVYLNSGSSKKTAAGRRRSGMYSMTGTIRAEQLEKFKEYLLERENAEATIQKYLTDIRTFIKYLGREQTLDKKSILEYKGWLIERYAVNSANSMLAALNQFLGFLGLDTLKVKRVRIQKSLFLDEEKELTKKEYQRLLRTAKSEGRHQLCKSFQQHGIYFPPDPDRVFSGKGIRRKSLSGRGHRNDHDQPGAAECAYRGNGRRSADAVRIFRTL